MSTETSEDVEAEPIHLLQRNKKHAHTESFESFSDLMTLLTTALIIITVLMGLEYSSNESKSDVIRPILKEAEKGSAAEVVLEEDTIVFLFSVDAYDTIMLQGGQGRRTFNGSPSGLNSFLDKNHNAIERAMHVFVVTDRNPVSKRNGFVISTLTWFAKEQLNAPTLIIWEY